MESISSATRVGDSLWTALAGAYLATLMAPILINGTEILLSGPGILLGLAVLAILSVVYGSCGLALKQDRFFAVPLTILVSILSTMGWGVLSLFFVLFAGVGQVTRADGFAVGLPAVANFALFLAVLRHSSKRRSKAHVAHS